MCILISLSELVIRVSLICLAADRKYSLRHETFVGHQILNHQHLRYIISFRVVFLQINDFTMYQVALILFFNLIILVVKKINDLHIRLYSFLNFMSYLFESK